MEVPIPNHLEDLNLLNAAFRAHGLTTFCSLDAWGPTVTRQRIAPDRAALEWRVTAVDD
ncbi:hypothetical protein [Demequina salsinemoris]|uniref:hypothetical protein n=1 Tax=Demequina salsinemoris TaxID=577470 RepID=UPI000B1F841D|nr:hypothetical protein [Demequina salsinemoris]